MGYGWSELSISILFNLSLMYMEQKEMQNVKVQCLGPKLELTALYIKDRQVNKLFP